MDRESLHSILTGVSWRDTINLFLTAAIAGLLGGCGTVAFWFTWKQRVGVYAFILLTIGTLTGMMMGVLLASIGSLWIFQVHTSLDIIAASMVTGFFSSVSVLLFSIATKVTLKYSNLVLEINLQKRQPPTTTQETDEHG